METTRGGLSGATITVGDRLVDKSGPRCREQGEWLYFHESPVLPAVRALHDGGYGMEILSAPTEPISLAATVNRLGRLWVQPAMVRWDPFSTRAKLEGLLDRYEDEVAERVDEVRMRILKAMRYSAIEPGLTHGDPTYENLLMRGDAVVLADPIPATPAVPDLVEVDKGKLLQSALGWEEAVRGIPRAPWDPEDVLALGERGVIVGWCLVHLLRTLPYVDDHAGVIHLIDAALAL